MPFSKVDIRIVEKLSNFNFFSKKSERESQRLTGESCYFALRPKEDFIDIKFEVLENKIIVTQGVILKNHTLILFTSSESHTMEYIKKTKKILNKYVSSLDQKYLYTYTIREYTESIKFLKWIGFYMSSREGVFEKWVLQKK